MRKFKEIYSVAAVISEINIDTDAIIPKQFLKTIERKGLGKSLFYERRYLNNYKQNPNFILNKEPWTKSKIIIAGENFGCGSSREHAPWALLDFGIECVIAPSFADIFFNNSIKNGLLPLVLKPEFIAEIEKLAIEKEKIRIILEKNRIIAGDNIIDFDMEEGIKNRLLKGLDDIELTFKYQNEITIYEEKQKQNNQWLFLDDL